MTFRYTRIRLHRQPTSYLASRIGRRKRDRSVRPGTVRVQVNRNVIEKVHEPFVLVGVSRLRDNDSVTGGHLLRVGHLVVELHKCTE